MRSEDRPRLVRRGRPCYSVRIGNWIIRLWPPVSRSAGGEELDFWVLEFARVVVPRSDSRPSVVLAWLTKPVTGVAAEVLNPALAAALLFALAVKGLPVSTRAHVERAGALRETR